MKKTYYAVTTSFYDSGRVTAAITDTIKADTQPANKYYEGKRCDVYVDWFDSLKAAEKHVKEAKMA